MLTKWPSKVCAHCTVVKRFGRVKAFFLLFSKMKSRKIQRFSRQLHKIKFETFCLIFCCCFLTLKSYHRGRKKPLLGQKSIHTLNHQLSNNYLNEEIRRVFFSFLHSVWLLFLYIEHEMRTNGFRKNTLFLARNKTNAVHIFNRRTHSNMRCYAMKRKNQWVNNLALALVIRKLPSVTQTHTECNSHVLLLRWTDFVFLAHLEWLSQIFGQYFNWISQ